MPPPWLAQGETSGALVWDPFALTFVAVSTLRRETLKSFVAFSVVGFLTSPQRRGDVKSERSPCFLFSSFHFAAMAAL